MIKFIPIDDDLTSIYFDGKIATLYLPKVKLDNNTNVIPRILVAFRALVVLGAIDLI